MKLSVAQGLSRSFAGRLAGSGLAGLGLTGWLVAALSCASPEINSRGNGASSSKPSDPVREPGTGSGAGSGGGSGGPVAPPALSLPDAGGAGVAPDLAPAVPETCAEESHVATRVPLDVFFLLDASGSMSLKVGSGVAPPTGNPDAGVGLPPVAVPPVPGTPTGAGKSKLDLVREAVNAFLKDPKSEGLGVAMSFFPSLMSCEKDSDCPAGGNIFFPTRCTGAPDAGCVQAGSDMVKGLCNLARPVCPAGSTCMKVGRCNDVTGPANCVLGGKCPSGSPCAPIQHTCNGLFGSDCTGARYAKPLVDFADLPAAGASFSSALAGREPNGGTPLGEAVIGTLPVLRARMMAHPDRQVVLVIASDGAPDPSCGNTAAILMALKDAHAAKPPLSTYAIGVFGQVELANGRMLMSDIAAAGGTNKPYVLDETMNLGDAFLKALNEIRGSALPCEFEIPKGTGASAAIDFDKVNLRWQGGAGDELVGYVGSVDRCDAQKGGWYYDVNPSAGKPTRVVVCPATCTKIKSDTAGKVELRFGCKTRTVE